MQAPASPRQPDIAPLRLRRNVRDMMPDDPDLVTFISAVAAMKNRTDRTSPLHYDVQAAIHQNCIHSSPYFFPWHRAYLFYFERLCQQLSGRDHFALPYWDWTSQRTIPCPFLDSKSALFDGSRNNALELDSEEFDPAGIDEILDYDFARFAGDVRNGQCVAVYGGALEVGLHSRVHQKVGGKMATPSTAAEDPLFWMHHANVDRLWSLWSQRHPGCTPTEALWEKRPLGNFWSLSNGTLILNTPNVDFASTTESLGYRYDLPEAKSPIACSVPPALDSTTRTIASASPINRAPATAPQLIFDMDDLSALVGKQAVSVDKVRRAVRNYSIRLSLSIEGAKIDQADIYLCPAKDAAHLSPHSAWFVRRVWFFLSSESVAGNGFAARSSIVLSVDAVVAKLIEAGVKPRDVRFVIAPQLSAGARLTLLDAELVARESGG